MGRIDLFDADIAERRYQQDHKAMRGYMGSTFQMAVNQNHGDHTKALAELREGLERDRRFDPFDKERLIDRFSQCYQTGAYLDFDNDGLRPGTEPRQERPLTNSRFIESPNIVEHPIKRR